MVLSENIVTALYIAASVLFILSLGGLSGQESAKRAVWYGIVGMAIAVIGTIFSPAVTITSSLLPLLILAIHKYTLRVCHVPVIINPSLLLCPSH